MRVSDLTALTFLGTRGKSSLASISAREILIYVRFSESFVLF